MIEFKVKQHAIRQVQVVEVYVDGVFRAALYPLEPDGVRLISSHFSTEPHKEGDLPSWTFRFEGR